MKNENSKIKIVEKLTGYVFLEADLHESDKVFAYAAELENLGIDIEVINPTLTQSLLTSLGVNEAESLDYLESLELEIESHESGPNCSSCFKS